MGAPLTINSSVKCSHPSPGSLVLSGSAKLTVGGAPVLLQADITAAAFLPPCGLSSVTGATPCTKVQSILPPSFASKLTVSGQPVVLDSLAGVTVSTPPGTYSAVAGQSKLTAV